MYVCYIEGRLEVICYAYDNTQSATSDPENSSTRQPCQTMGGWTDVASDGGPIVLQGHFYSNRWDFRKERQLGKTTITRYTSDKLAAWPRWRQKHPLSTSFFAWTEVGFYTNSVTTVVPIPPTRDLSVAIPMHDRSAYYMGTLDMKAPEGITYRGAVHVLQAKITEEWELHHNIFAWVGSVGCPPEMFVDPGPLDCWGRKRCVYVDDEACPDDYAIGDFWLEACRPAPPGRNWIAGPIWDPPELPEGYEYNITDDPGQAICNIHFVNDTPYGETIAKHEDDTYDGATSMSSWWWKASPDEDGNIANIQAVNSCLGEHVTNLMDDFDGNVVHLSVLEYMFGNWNCCYTGVIE
jgi:hypothetical protein